MSRDDEAYPLVQKAAMQTWETGAPFRETLRVHAAEAGLTLDEKRLDEVCRPERFVKRLGPMFDRLTALR
jgi:adenylosuccinate lyase